MSTETPPLCARGHEQTADNTAVHGKRTRCKACKREYARESRGGLKGTNPTVDAQGEAFLNRLDDMYDLIRFGATYQEIVERSGYASEQVMGRALRKAGQRELLDTIRKRRN